MAVQVRIHLAVTTADARGKAFEAFVSILLSKLGYRVTKVRVGRAGRELDIQAEAIVTGAPLIAECKGHSRVIGGDTLREFYGVYDHEYRKATDGRLSGLLVSLSGFKGDATDYYDEKDPQVRTRFRIVGPGQLVAHAVSAELIVDPSVVRHLSAGLWSGDLGASELVVTERGYYWVQRLMKDGRNTHFLVFRAKADEPTTNEIEHVQRSVKSLHKLEPLNVLARREILLQLAQHPTGLSSTALSEATGHSVATVEMEIVQLLEQSLVQGAETFALVTDLRAFSDVARDLLKSNHRYSFLQTPYFADMNNNELAKYCYSRRGIEDVPEPEIASLPRVFAVSPHALNEALFGDTSVFNATAQHARQIGSEADKIGDIMRSRFVSDLIPDLLHDLHDRENQVLRSLQGAPAVMEEHVVSLARNEGLVFKLHAGGIFHLGRADGNIAAGQLITADLRTRLVWVLTDFHLDPGARTVSNLVNLYQQLAEVETDPTALARAANNVGACFMALGRAIEARDWLERAAGLEPSLEEVQDNLRRAQRMLADEGDAKRNGKDSPTD